MKLLYENKKTNHIRLISGIGFGTCVAHAVLTGVVSLLIPVIGKFAPGSLVFDAVCGLIFFFESAAGGLTLLTLQGKEGLRRAIVMSMGWLCLWNLAVGWSLNRAVGPGFWLCSGIACVGVVACLQTTARRLSLPGLKAWRVSKGTL